MAIAPNTTFVSGAILTAAQQNAFGFGTMALAKGTTNFALTTTVTIATSMTVSFTAIASRNYKITYYEPNAQITDALGGNTNVQIRQTNAAGTLLNAGIIQNTAARGSNQFTHVLYVGTLSAGSVTIVGCANTSSISDGPNLVRSATAPSFLLVEDIGPA